MVALVVIGILTLLGSGRLGLLHGHAPRLVGSWGENIELRPGPFAAARVAADGWLNSEHHRENLFDPRSTEQGIAEVVVPEFQSSGRPFQTSVATYEPSPHG